MNKAKSERFDVDIQEVEVMQGVLLGYLMRTENSIKVGRYNTLATELGLLKQNKQGLQEILQELAQDPVLRHWHEQAIIGAVGLEDLYAREEGRIASRVTPERIKNILSPSLPAHEEVLANNREFRAVQRAGAHTERLFQGLKRELHEVLISNQLNQPMYIRPAYQTVSTSTRVEGILAFSDFHVGAEVFNTATGGYNFEKLKARSIQFLTEAVATAKKHQVEHVHVYFVGDLIEHINMRNVNQAFEAEFTATEQIAKGTRLLYEIICEVARNFEKVTFGMVGGNHDRFQGNKGDKIYNDNVAYLSLDTLFLLQGVGALPENVYLIDNRDDVYSFTDKVAGKNVKVIHGDFEAKKDDVKIRTHIRNEEIHYMIMGHIHTTRIVQEDFSRYHVYVGSPMGANNYSTEHNFPTTEPTQMLILINPDTDAPIFNPITLK